MLQQEWIDVDNRILGVLVPSVGALEYVITLVFGGCGIEYTQFTASDILRPTSLLFARTMANCPVRPLALVFPPIKWLRSAQSTTWILSQNQDGTEQLNYNLLIDSECCVRRFADYSVSKYGATRSSL